MTLFLILFDVKNAVTLKQQTPRRDYVNRAGTTDVPM